MVKGNVFKGICGGANLINFDVFLKTTEKYLEWALYTTNKKSSVFKLNGRFAQNIICYNYSFKLAFYK